jgi:hypothetical protein
MCALYGSSRDISFFHVINTELIHNIIEQNVGYYQISLDETQTNVYGEAKDGTKMYLPPVLIQCLIDRGGYEADYAPIGPNITRNFSFRFLRTDLVAQNVVPQIGDVVLWNNDYYEINLVNENQDIVGKVPQYNYGGEYLDNFGASFSILCSAHYISPEKLGLNQVR